MDKINNEFDYDQMVKHPSESANDIGNKVPYHLQYLRDGKPVVKPKGEKDGSSTRNEI